MASNSIVVEAPAGMLGGIEDGGLRVFKGVPYASPPVGDARWKPPAPMLAWKGVRQATAFGPPCTQPDYPAGSIYAAELPAGSEDCLSLNIWAPKEARGAPVFVWIHGGALWRGCSCDPMYDGVKLAGRGLVVVSINYRMGILGYLAHPELSAESPDGISGNYGLLDQVAALRWVRDNIAAFGGDPANVAIAGESAGGLSVLYLMASPLAKGLFSKAIAQSAYMISTPALREEQHGEKPAETAGLDIAAALGAKNLAELRAMDARQITDAALRAGFLPFAAIDGKIMPRQLVDVFDRGEQARVPLLAGFNSGEIRSLRFLAPKPPEDAAAYTAIVRRLFGDLADRFLALYPPSDMEESILAAARDAIYGWTAERLAVKQSALGLPAYLYVFDHGYPAADDAGLHAFHAAELPYLFGSEDDTPPLWPKIPGTSEERELGAAMAGYWASFARTATPLADGQPDWMPYADGAAHIRFAGRPHAGIELFPGMYDLHEEVVSRRRAAGNVPWNWNFGIASPAL